MAIPRSKVLTPAADRPASPVQTPANYYRVLAAARLQQRTAGRVSLGALSRQLRMGEPSIKRAYRQGFNTRAGAQYPWAPPIVDVLRYEAATGIELPATPEDGLLAPLPLLPEPVEAISQWKPPPVVAVDPNLDLATKLERETAAHAADLELERRVKREALTTTLRLAASVNLLASGVEVEMASAAIGGSEPMEPKARIALMRSLSEVARNMSAIARASSESERDLLTEDPRGKPSAQAPDDMTEDEAKAMLRKMRLEAVRPAGAPMPVEPIATEAAEAPAPAASDRVH